MNEFNKTIDIRNFRSFSGFLVLMAMMTLVGSLSLYMHSYTHSTVPNIKNTKLRNISEYTRPKAISDKLRDATFHPSGTCNIAYINSQYYDSPVNIERGTIIGVGGFLYNKIDKDVPLDAWLIIKNASTTMMKQVHIDSWSNRPDVRRALGGNPNYTRSGFIVDFYTNSLDIGKYRLYVMYKGKDKFYTCDNGREFSIN